MSFEPFTEDDLVASEECLLKLGQLYLRYIQESAKEGINADGEPLPKHVDLYRTGNLLYRDVSFRVSAWSVEVQFNAPYAADVEKRFHFNGIPPQKMAQFLEECSVIVANGVSTKE